MPARTQMVDRGFARMVAIKRIATGTASLVAGGILVALVSTHQHTPTAMVAIALLLFWGGGGWSLYDGIRVMRMLKSR